MSAQIAAPPLQAETERCRAAQAKWAATPLAERLAAVRRLRDRLFEQRKMLCEAVQADLGRPPEATLPGEIYGLAEACGFVCRRAHGLLRSRRTPRGDRPIWLMGQRDEVARRPRGIVGIIGTWNYPVFLNGVQIVQALAAGNGVIWKPSEVAPRSAEAVGAWVDSAGLPPDVFIRLPAEREGGKLLADADIDHVVFTGQASTGRLLAANLGRRLISSTLELSGCDAQFVLDDADVSLAAKAAWWGCNVNNGQTCISVRRAFVHRSLYPTFVQQLEPLAKAAKPVRLMTPGQASAADELIDDAVRGGARLLAERPAASEAQRFLPAVLADAAPDMAICRRDSFAPIMAVLPYDDLNAAIEQSRRCGFDLGVSVFTREPRRASALAERLGAGMCTVNDVIVPTAHPATPFGGRKASGWGSTQGAEGLLEMTLPQVISVRDGSYRPHYEPAGASKMNGLPFFDALCQWQYAPSFGQRLRGFLKLLGVVMGKG